MQYVPLKLLAQAEPPAWPPPTHVRWMGHGLARVAVTAGRQKPEETLAVMVVVPKEGHWSKPTGHDKQKRVPVMLSTASLRRSSKNDCAQMHDDESSAGFVVVLDGQEIHLSPTRKVPCAHLEG